MFSHNLNHITESSILVFSFDKDIVMQINVLDVQALDHITFFCIIFNFHVDTFFKYVIY